jgi:hypothetical protein
MIRQFGQIWRVSKYLCNNAHINFVLINKKPYNCVLIHMHMNSFEMKKVEMELRNFTARNFEKPSNCRNAAQIRFYISELCSKIEEYEKRFNYVPDWAYALLNQYTIVQNSFVHLEFVKCYA